MWCEQFNAEMLSDLDTIRTDESTVILHVGQMFIQPWWPLSRLQFAHACYATKNMDEREWVG